MSALAQSGYGTRERLAEAPCERLVLLHADSLSPDLVRDTLNVILKFEQDIVAVEPQIVELLHRR